MYAKASITSLVINPPSGPQGTTFDIVMTYKVTNTTGTVMLILQINPPDAPPLSANTLVQSQVPDTYTFSAQLQSVPQNGEPFNPYVNRISIYINFIKITNYFIFLF